jgi:hypothetical protein
MKGSHALIALRGDYPTELKIMVLLDDASPCSSIFPRKITRNGYNRW